MAMDKKKVSLRRKSESKSKVENGGDKRYLEDNSVWTFSDNSNRTHLEKFIWFHKKRNKR